MFLLISRRCPAANLLGTAYHDSKNDNRENQTIIHPSRFSGQGQPPLTAEAAAAVWSLPGLAATATPPLAPAATPRAPRKATAFCSGPGCAGAWAGAGPDCRAAGTCRPRCTAAAGAAGGWAAAYRPGRLALTGRAAGRATAVARAGTAVCWEGGDSDEIWRGTWCGAGIP